MDVILDRLDKFRYEAKPSACSKNCRQDYKRMVRDVQTSVREYFDGLCLDCLSRSKPKLGDADRDYWRHGRLREHEWVRGCRFPHKQPTWYFSFNGRKEDRDRLVKAEGLDRKRGRHFEDSDDEDNEADEDR